MPPRGSKRKQPSSKDNNDSAATTATKDSKSSSASSSSSSSSSSSAAGASTGSGGGGVSILDDIRSTTAFVVQHSTHVTIDEAALESELDMHADRYNPKPPNLPPRWTDSPYHYTDQKDEERT